MIGAQEGKSESASKILTSVKERLTEKNDFDFRSGLDAVIDAKVIHVVVRNDGDEVANDVRLVLPGSGRAEISEIGYFDVRKPTLAWNKVLQIGPVRPHTNVEVLVWPEESTFMGLLGVNAAVIHAGGSGRVKYPHSFVGWDADVVAWFVSQAWFVRYGLGFLAAALLAVVIRLLARRGYIVLRPQGRSTRVPDRTTSTP
jgi:hypothetical protein